MSLAEAEKLYKEYNGEYNVDFWLKNTENIKKIWKLFGLKLGLEDDPFVNYMNYMYHNIDNIKIELNFL